MINVKEVIDGFQSFVDYVTRRLFTLIVTFVVFDWALHGAALRGLTAQAAVLGARFQTWTLALDSFDGLIGAENRQAALFVAFLFLVLGSLHVGYELLRTLGRLLPFRVMSSPYAVAQRFSWPIVDAWRYHARTIELDDFVKVVLQRASGRLKRTLQWWLFATELAQGWMMLAFVLLIFAPGPFGARADLFWIVGGCAAMLGLGLLFERRAYSSSLGGPLMEAVAELIAEAKQPPVPRQEAMILSATFRDERFYRPVTELAVGYPGLVEVRDLWAQGRRRLNEELVEVISSFVRRLMP